MLYDVDYRKISDEDLREYHRIRESEIVNSPSGGRLRIRRGKSNEYPKAARHYFSLFPNNYLDVRDLKKRSEDLRIEIAHFAKIIDLEGCTERMIVEEIRKRKMYWMISSLMGATWFEFGHHAAYMFKEFDIGNRYKADYLLVGRGSGGWGYIFVELEGPRGSVVLEDGGFAGLFRNGINQTYNWRDEITGNWKAITNELSRFLKGDENLPGEFIPFDPSRVHFAVVAGRREDFNSTAYRRKRDLEVQRLHLFHYDNIIDLSNSLLSSGNY